MKPLLLYGLPLVVALSAVVLVAGLYNGLVRHRNKVRSAWSGIDVQLKRRHNLVPALVSCVEGYQRHEQSVLTEVTQARAAAGGAHDSGESESAESAVTIGLKHLFALAERYPDLEADERFRQLGEQLVEIEDQIQYARRYYNGAVRDYNNRTETFPSLLLARTFGFASLPFYRIERALERENPDVDLS